MDENELKGLLDSRGIKFEIKRHKPVFNIEEACRELGVDPEHEVKNLLLKDETGFFMVILTGNALVDFNSVRKARGVKKVRLALPEEVKAKTGVEIGSVNLFSFPTVLLDRKVTELPTLNTHPDDNSVTFFIPTADALGLLENMVVGDFSKPKF